MREVSEIALNSFNHFEKHVVHIIYAAGPNSLWKQADGQIEDELCERLFRTDLAIYKYVHVYNFLFDISRIR